MVALISKLGPSGTLQPFPLCQRENQMQSLNLKSGGGQAGTKAGEGEKSSRTGLRPEGKKA